LTRRRNCRAKASNRPWPPLIKMDKQVKDKITRYSETPLDMGSHP
jgi:hypothetical protein